MFSPGDREEILRELVRHARADPAVTAAALVGSAARKSTDAWSDIDLALRLQPEVDPTAVAGGWTRHIASLAPIADHLDLWSGGTLYRVFLLDDSLQVDLSFWPADDFASTGEPFELIFGTANPVHRPHSPDEAHDDLGWAWLYALHARSAIARGRHWQAVEMLEGLRGRLVSLACRRHGLPTHHGRGVDGLPPTALAALATTLAAQPVIAALMPAFRAATSLLLVEAEQVDSELAHRLRTPLAVIVDSVTGTGTRAQE